MNNHIITTERTFKGFEYEREKDLPQNIPALITKILENFGVYHPLHPARTFVLGTKNPRTHRFDSSNEY